jgi:hypothetical protein
VGSTKKSKHSRSRSRSGGGKSGAAAAAVADKGGKKEEAKPVVDVNQRLLRYGCIELWRLTLNLCVYRTSPFTYGYAAIESLNYIIL